MAFQLGHTAFHSAHSNVNTYHSAVKATLLNIYLFSTKQTMVLNVSKWDFSNHFLAIQPYGQHCSDTHIFPIYQYEWIHLFPLNLQAWSWPFKQVWCLGLGACPAVQSKFSRKVELQWLVDRLQINLLIILMVAAFQLWCFDAFSFFVVNDGKLNLFEF